MKMRIIIITIIALLLNQMACEKQDAPVITQYSENARLVEPDSLGAVADSLSATLMHRIECSEAVIERFKKKDSGRLMRSIDPIYIQGHK